MTPAEIVALIARLRDPVYAHKRKDELDAADALAALARENAELRAQKKYWTDQAKTVSNLSDRLERAEVECAAAYELAAKMCEGTVTRPAGYGGQFEGYGPVKTERTGSECAAAIRAIAAKEKG